MAKVISSLTEVEIKNQFYGRSTAEESIVKWQDDEQRIQQLAELFYQYDMQPDTNEEMVANFIKVAKLYDHVFTLMANKLPSATYAQRSNLHDHAVTFALNPEFYGEAMVNRFNNMMLIAALLLSTCVSTLLAPPKFDVTDAQQAVTMRVWNYITYLSTTFLLFDLVLGFKFLEDCISRNVTEGDRVCSIVREWHIKAAFSAIFFTSCVLIVTSIAISISASFQSFDVLILSICTVVCTLSLTIAITFSTLATSKLQEDHIAFFKKYMCKPMSKKESESGFELLDEISSSLARIRAKNNSTMNDKSGGK